MIFDILSLFPEMFDSPFAGSILGKAVEKKLIDIRCYPLRQWAEGRHQVTDDAPYGGGDGMVMKPEPVYRALQALREADSAPARVLLMTPQGTPFTQSVARRLSQCPRLVFVCGRYEGFDERIRGMVDEEISLGDFVLTGGEFPAMVMIDAVARLLPGVLGNSQSCEGDSFSDGLLEFPHYTRPAEFNGERVPDVLLSGHHGKIEQWRRQQQLLRTLERRPELLDRLDLSIEDKKVLAALRAAKQA